MTATFKDLSGIRQITLADLVNHDLISFSDALTAAGIKKREPNPFEKRIQELLESRKEVYNSKGIPEEFEEKHERWLNSLEAYFNGIAGKCHELLSELEIAFTSEHLSSLPIFSSLDEAAVNQLKASLNYNRRITQPFFAEEVNPEYLAALESCWVCINPFLNFWNEETEEWVKPPLQYLLTDIAEAEDYSLREANAVAEMLRAEAVKRGAVRGKIFLY